MDSINNRIYELRKNILNISMEKFGERIGITKSSVNSLEKGVNNPSEQTIKSICREFNVSIMWLKEGLGDIFTNLPETLLDELADEYNISTIDKKIVKLFLELNKEERDAFTSTLRKMLID